MAQASLATLRNVAFQMADQANTVTESSSPNDVVNTGFVPVSEMNKYINFGYKKLYGMLTMTYEKYFITSTDISMVDGQEDYALPSDFGVLWGVDLLPGGDASRRLTLREFSWAERNRYRDFAFTLFGRFHEWSLYNNSLRVAPLPGSSGDVLRLHYTPEVTELVADTDTVLTEPMFDEYISTYAAIRALDKEESDSSALRANLADLEKFVREFGEARQVAEPRAISVTNDDYQGQLISPYSTGFGEGEY